MEKNDVNVLKKVSAHYGKIQALHDVSLHINQGEIVTLIGANGAGKTTLLGTLCGDPRASSGRVVFDGKDITDWQTAKIMREAVAIVPEGRRVFSRMTVEENLAMGGFFAERDRFQGAYQMGVRAVSAPCMSAVSSERAPCPAANSRCWRLAAR
ncbi:high-affinity branched-chain amino acid transport ATP-binding protein [Salmonella enterica subsp. enterica serovar Typhimurium]|nr:high-affinity branched-chain amino acid transport ATP-binding protein [Salmonella enterica subsp. enterica serovar Typhimurium]